MSRHCMRRCPRPVPRPHGAFQDWREVPRHQLPVHGRLCGQRLLFCRDSHTPCVSQGEALVAHRIGDFVYLDLLCVSTEFSFVLSYTL